jgi:exodeoxyribonuclease VII large subunit
MQDPKFFSLSAVTHRIQQILQPAIGKCFWVKAEIASGRERGGSFYCDLVETNGQGQIIAQMRCTIWSRDLASIRQKFADCNLSLTLDNGSLVGFQCALQYNPKFGLSLCVTDADPTVALGALEIKKQQILEQLEKEGLFALNKAVALPALPHRIGLVTSAGSAAYNDFVKTLALSGYGFIILLADAVVQGERTQASVLKALDSLERLKPDLVVVVRGGGSKTDLFYLDNESIARAIAACKHPVWTGIGHEIDTSVLDYVANRAFKTPTAVAEELVSRFKEMAAHLEEAQNRFRTTWAYRLDSARRYLQDADTGIRQGTRKLLDTQAAALGSKVNQLSYRVTSRLAGEKARLAVFKKILGSAPMTLVQQSGKIFHEWGRRIRNSGNRLLVERLADLNASSSRFRKERFERQLIRQTDRVKELQVRLAQVAQRRITLCEREQISLKKRFQMSQVLKRISGEQSALSMKLGTVKACDPANNLKRGFALVYDQAGALIKTVKDARAGQTIKTTFYDGSVISTVEPAEEKNQ